jgi:hypothetical protein
MAQPTALQRAFTLARTGNYRIGEIKTQLKAEGFDMAQLYGPALMRQLREICTSAQDAAE